MSWIINTEDGSSGQDENDGIDCHQRTLPGGHCSDPEKKPNWRQL